MSESTTDVVRACFDAYLAQDRAAMERLLADDLTFTSPQDDHIDRAAFFERCFPSAPQTPTQEIIAVVPDGAGHVLTLYQYTGSQGGTYRNVEVHTVRGGQVHEIQVFFGGQVR